MSDEHKPNNDDASPESPKRRVDNPPREIEPTKTNERTEGGETGQFTGHGNSGLQKK